MKRLALLIACCCLILNSTAQYYTNQNKVWTFGNGAGIDFTSGSPAVVPSSINTMEGCASVCNSVGSLRFYTDGKTVYNRLGAIMPSGSSIVPFYVFSSSQGAVIVPFFNDTNKYYIFSLEHWGVPGVMGRLAYSIVDMTLAGGLGDIVPGSAGILLDSGMSEKMIAVRGDNCNMWLLTHKVSTAQFCAYEITASGINTTPVISAVGTFAGATNYGIGIMKCSPDRQKIALACYPFESFTAWGIELYDFNPATGIVSNCRVLEGNIPGSMPYGCEFSPDNTKLYSTDYGVFQWDISLPTLSAIIASKTSIYPTPTALYTDIKIGADSKLYFNHVLFGSFVDCITNPNLSGTACGFTPFVIDVWPAIINHGFPNVVWSQNGIFANASTLCIGTTATLTPSLPGGVWSSSNPAVATISTGGLVTAMSPGTTAISYTTGGSCGGSIVLTVVSAPTITGAYVCIGGTTTLSATTGSGTWTSSSTAIATIGGTTGVMNGLTSGTATITYNGPGCPAVTIIATVATSPSITAGTVCVGNTITATSSLPGGTWTSSSPTTATIIAASGVLSGIVAGTSVISYTSPGCLSTAVVTVNPIPFITTGSVCVGATLSLSSIIAGGTWSSASTSIATVGASSGTVTGISAGTAVITYSNGCIATSTVTVNPAIIIPGITLCPGSTTTLTGSAPGGTWSSSAPSVASVGISSGIVTAGSLGTASIFYNLSAGCPEVGIVTVNAMSSPIGGKLTLCETFSTVLNCSPAGGTWSSSTPNVTISSSGLATGITAGTAIITYMLVGGCYSTAIVTVNPLPATIAGPTTVVAGANITLTNATTGGSWSSSDSTIAQPASTGVITGVTSGTATIYYTLPTGCKQSVVITVTSKNTVAIGSVIIAKPTLYPNPATNEITITTELSTFLSFAIYNALGQEMMVQNITVTETKTNIKALPPGEYLIVFTGSCAREMIRFTKW